MNVADTGLPLTGYAWMVMLMSLPLVMVFQRMERKRLMLLLMVTFIAGNALSAFAQDFVSLMVSRLIVACAHAVFWAIVTPACGAHCARRAGAAKLGHH